MLQSSKDEQGRSINQLETLFNKTKHPQDKNQYYFIKHSYLSDNTQLKQLKLQVFTVFSDGDSNDII